MPHLDPSHPPLWRTPTTLQFGRTGLVRIDDPALWQLRLIRELARGIPEIAVAAMARSLGAEPHEVGGFLDLIGPVLIRDSRPLRVLVEVPEDPSAALAETVARTLQELGLDVEAAPGTHSHPDVVVLLAAHGLHPRRSAAWLRDDVPHLPLVLGNGTAELGPLVLPGVSACLVCVAAHERDQDPLWPVLSAQLIGRTDPIGPVALAVEAALHAGRMITAGHAGQSLRIDRSGELSRGRWLPHPECSCRALQETVTATDPASPSTTTATAFAVPA